MAGSLAYGILLLHGCVVVVAAALQLQSLEPSKAGGPSAAGTRRLWDHPRIRPRVLTGRVARSSN